MGISTELLLKAAKVYDCSEPVEGMKPKMQYEEHKDMSADEFSREKTEATKEAIAPHVAAMVAPQILGKNFLAAISRKMLPHAAADLGGLAGGLAGVVGGGIHGAYDPGSYAGLDDKGNPALKRRSRLMGALRGAAGYGAGGLVGGRVLGAAGGMAAAPYMYPLEESGKAAAAHSFGEKLARVVFKK